MYDSLQHSIGIEQGRGTVRNFYIKNNIFSSSFYDDYKHSGTVSNVIFDNNLFYGHSGTGTNIRSGDPLFIDPNVPTSNVNILDALGFKVASNSPAVNAGVSPPNPLSFDFEDDVRPSGGTIDIGAFEK
jgi:hypothetical protein